MLARLFHPRSVCVVGASGDPSRLAGRPLERLSRHGYSGRVFAVNPKYTELGGYPCVASIDDLPSGIDVALIVIPADRVAEAIRACGRRGIPYAVVLSSGFEDDSGGANRVKDLRDSGRESGVRIVGPNSEGLWSVPENLALTFGSAAGGDPFIPGYVSVISQSGSVGAACMRELQVQGVGCRYFISSGNETDLTTLDYLEYLLDEGGSRVITLFLEGMKEGHRLRRLAQRAIEAGVRIIALRSGTSELGRMATASHTGRVATAATIYADIFRQLGVLEVGTFSEMVNATLVAARTVALPPIDWTGSGEDGAVGVGIIGISGGARALLADSSAQRRVPLARFSEQTLSALTELLPPFGYSENPTDVTGEVMTSHDLFANVLGLVAADSNTNAILVQYANGAEKQLSAHMDKLQGIIEGAQKPVIVSLLGPTGQSIKDLASNYNVIVAADPDDAIRTVSWLNYFSRVSERVLGQLPQVESSMEPTDGHDLGHWEGRARFISEAGLTVPPWVVVDSSYDVEGLTESLAFPVAVKALPEAAEHKTDLGLVALNVSDNSRLALEIDRIARLSRCSRVLVQEMATGDLEVLLAIHDDPDFGAIMTIGSGGIRTEWMADIGHILIPATDSEIRTALGRLKLAPLLEEFRGRGPLNADAIVEAAQKLSLAYLSRIGSDWDIEINPLMVFRGGRDAVAVDVLVTPSQALSNKLRRM